MSLGTLNTFGLTCFPKILSGFVKGIALGILHGTVVGVHVRDCKTYGCLLFCHCLKQGIDIGGVYVIHLCQHLSGSLNSLIEAVKVPRFQVL